MTSTTTNTAFTSAATPIVPTGFAWSYDEAFARNRGLISAEEQEKLRTSHVAIAGMGGVGGVHLVTLARLGIGQFSIADYDTFEVANFNRQYGATVENLGKSKVDAMADVARSINPEVELRILRCPITKDNVDEFLDGVDVVLDGIDFFNIEARRVLFRAAREKRLWAITAGPIGFSAAWLAFDPNGMTFDAYFGIRDGMSEREKLAAFAVGLTPRAPQRHYFDLSQVNLESQSGPCCTIACQICSGVAAAEVLKILLNRGNLRAAPHYAQFDMYLSRFYRGRVTFGTRVFLKLARRWLLRRVAI